MSCAGYGQFAVCFLKYMFIFFLSLMLGIFTKIHHYFSVQIIFFLTGRLFFDSADKCILVLPNSQYIVYSSEDCQFEFWSSCQNSSPLYLSKLFLHSADKVVLLSYNILAVENASKHQDLYSKVLPKYLNWDRRKKLLCEEIRRYSASILCFQASLSIFVSIYCMLIVVLNAAFSFIFSKKIYN